MKTKLQDLFDNKSKTIEDWNKYLKENNCEIVDENDDLIADYCLENNLIAIFNSKGIKPTYILIPQSFAEKILVLGYLP